MVKSKCKYLGGLRCELEHEPSRSKIETDAPTDNHGRGERFSPTDLVGAALSSCVLTTIGIVCQRDGVELMGAHAEVEKEMSLNPRRISSLKIKFYLPSQIAESYRSKLEHLAHHCPVHASLHPDIAMPMEFVYSL